MSLSPIGTRGRPNINVMFFGFFLRNMKLPIGHHNEGENICQATSICELLSSQKDAPFYKDVKYVIMDDAQNYDSVPREELVHHSSNEESTENRVVTVDTADSQITGKAEASARTQVSANVGQEEEKSMHEKTPSSSSDNEAETQSLPGSLFEIQDEETHWLDRVQEKVGNLLEKKTLFIYDPTQSLGEDSCDKIKEFVTSANGASFSLQKICRNSYHISEFMYTTIVPKESHPDIYKTAEQVKESMAHAYVGRKPDIEHAKSISLDDLNSTIDCFMDHDHFKDDEIEIIIDDSAIEDPQPTEGYIVGAQDSQTSAPSAQPQARTPDASQHLDTSYTEDKEAKMQTQPLSMDHQSTFPASHVADETEPPRWGLVQDAIGMEKPVIIAILCRTAPLQRKIALASRARVRLSWIELEEPLTTQEMLAKLAHARKKQLYTLWYSKYISFIFISIIIHVHIVVVEVNSGIMILELWDKTK